MAIALLDNRLPSMRSGKIEKAFSNSLITSSCMSTKSGNSFCWSSEGKGCEAEAFEGRTL